MIKKGFPPYQLSVLIGTISDISVSTLFFYSLIHINISMRKYNDEKGKFQ